MSTEKKFKICSRAYKILTEEVKFTAQDIIFDPNIFAVATGISEHNNYAKDFFDENSRKLMFEKIILFYKKNL